MSHPRDRFSSLSAEEQFDLIESYQPAVQWPEDDGALALFFLSIALRVAAEFPTISNKPPDQLNEVESAALHTIVACCRAIYEVGARRVVGTVPKGPIQ